MKIQKVVQAIGKHELDYIQLLFSSYMDNNIVIKSASVLLSLMHSIALSITFFSNGE
jgi:hypothetical protein